MKIFVKMGLKNSFFIKKLRCLTLLHEVIHQKQPIGQTQNIAFSGLEFRWTSGKSLDCCTVPLRY